MDFSRFIELINKNIKFHAVLENEVNETPFGEITFNFQVKDGKVDMNTLNVVKNRRRRYNGESINLL